MATEALLSLGSNLGDRKELVDQAVTCLACLPRTKLAARSSYYKTDPVGPVAQEWFLNIAIALRTGLSPEHLLSLAHGIEVGLGRHRAGDIRWGPRPIDIDIIAFGRISRTDPNLTLPHPRFATRAFVLVPLAEIAAESRILGRSVADHLRRVGSAGVAKLDWPVPDSSECGSNSGRS